MKIVIDNRAVDFIYFSSSKICYSRNFTKSTFADIFQNPSWRQEEKIEWGEGEGSGKNRCGYFIFDGTYV